MFAILFGMSVAFNPENYRCGICLEVTVEPTRLSCGHFFDLPCIQRWLQMQPTCPVCRHTLEGREIAELRVDDGLALIVRTNVGDEHFVAPLRQLPDPEDDWEDLERAFNDVVRGALSVLVRDDFEDFERACIDMVRAVPSFVVREVPSLVVSSPLKFIFSSYFFRVRSIFAALYFSANQESLGDVLITMLLFQGYAYLVEFIWERHNRELQNGISHMLMSFLQLITLLSASVELFIAEEGQHTLAEAFLCLGLLIFLVCDCKYHSHNFSLFN